MVINCTLLSVVFHNKVKMAGLRSQKVLMTSIGALTLSDQQTTARRGSPIPQLRCIGKPCRTFQPTTVQCVPMGGKYSLNFIQKYILNQN